MSEEKKKSVTTATPPHPQGTRGVVLLLMGPRRRSTRASDRLNQVALGLSFASAVVDTFKTVFITDEREFYQKSVSGGDTPSP